VNFHNCTRFAAYYVAKYEGVTNAPNWGNAGEWGRQINHDNVHAMGYPLSSAPRVGDVAWKDSGGDGSSGHVAIVLSVGSGTVVVAEDNYYLPGIDTSTGYARVLQYKTNWFSGFIHIKPPAPPTQPGAPTATGTASNSITLSWPAVATASGYHIQYSTAAKPTAKQWVRAADSGAPSSTIGGLTFGTSYLFQVQAFNPTGPSPWSGWSNRVTTISKPAQPRAPTATSTASNSITLSWPAVGMAAGYHIQYSKVAKPTAQQWVRAADSASPSTTLSGLAFGTSYLFQVQAFNAAGASLWSGWSNRVSTLSTPAQPGTPTATSTGSNSIALSWPAVAGAAGYHIQYSTAAKPTAQQWVRAADSGAPSTTIGGLAFGTSYLFQVQTFNAAGASSWSGWSNRVSTLGTPAQPAAPRATVQNYTWITVSWPAAPGAASYQVQYATKSNPGNSDWTLAGSTSALSVSYNTAGAVGFRIFQVRALNNAGNSTWSGWSNGVTTSNVPVYAPGQPGKPSAGTPSTTQVSVSWPGVPGATSYELQWTHKKSPGNSDWSYWGSTGGTSVVIGVTTGQSFMFQVRARNSGGASSWSQWSNWVFTSVAVTVSQYASGGDSGHTCPDDSCKSGQTYPANHTIWIRCWVTGKNIQMPKQWGGSWTTVWDLASDGLYYTDAWLHTGSNNPIVPACDSGDVI
jgi:hypothetical protein